MTDGLHQATRQLTLHGDLAGMEAVMLHTTGWQQHGRTAYGLEHIRQCWMAWLQHSGVSRCLEEQVLDDGGQSLQLFSLEPEYGQSPVRLAIWARHDGCHVRAVRCIVDTSLLAMSLGQDLAVTAASLPRPDPLLLNGYDPGNHLHMRSFGPADIVDLPEDHAHAVTGWWRLWNDQDLAAINRFYAAEASIELPGMAEATDLSGLRRYATQDFTRVSQRHCHPESVVFDPAHPHQVGIFWQLEGNWNHARGSLRARSPRVSLLEISAGKIHRETLVVDQAALERSLGS